MAPVADSSRGPCDDRSKDSSKHLLPQIAAPVCPAEVHSPEKRIPCRGLDRPLPQEVAAYARTGLGRSRGMGYGAGLAMIDPP